LSQEFREVVGIDIDSQAIEFAKKMYKRKNLIFEIGDAMHLDFSDSSFDVVVCSHVYEHVPNARKMMSEIERVLRPGGVCYFAAGNRFCWNEPPYDLPLLSVLPRMLAHVYLRASGKGQYYYEKHLSYWGLRKLVNRFECKDYSRLVVDNPKKFSAEYMFVEGGKAAKYGPVIARYFIWLLPSYIWVLKKPSESSIDTA